MRKTIQPTGIQKRKKTSRKIAERDTGEVSERRTLRERLHLGSTIWSNLLSAVAICISVYVFWASSHESAEKEKFSIRVRTKLNTSRPLQILRREVYQYSDPKQDSPHLVFPVRVTVVNVSRLPQYLQSMDVIFENYLELNWKDISKANEFANHIAWPHRIDSMDALDMDVLLFYPLDAGMEKNLNTFTKSGRIGLGSMESLMSALPPKNGLRDLLLALPVREVKLRLHFLSPSTESIEPNVTVDFRLPMISSTKEGNINEDVVFASFRFN